MQISTIKKQKTNFIQLRASEIITQQDYREVIQQNESSLQQLGHTKLELEKKLKNSSNHKQVIIQKLLAHITKLDSLTPELLHRLIERLEIKADGTARIFYRFSLPSAIV